MAEPKKPTSTTRKKPAKRGPTKATALKSLGLTQEDLDLLKELKTARENAAAKVEEVVEPKTTVDPKISEPETEDKPQSGPWYIRNLRNVEVGFRLTRQEGSGKKRTNLKPRGQRGDLTKIEEADLTDDELLTQVNYNVVEIIPAAEAKKVLDNQSINQQQAVHPAMASLRNPLGQPYEQQNIPVVEDNSYTVANLKPQGGEAGELPSSGRGVDWGQIHQGGPGGNPAIISDGFAQAPDVAADIAARRKDLEGPAAGLGGVKVVVEPTRKT